MFLQLFQLMFFCFYVSLAHRVQAPRLAACSFATSIAPCDWKAQSAGVNFPRMDPADRNL
jgi:hypothetical protein